MNDMNNPYACSMEELFHLFSGSLDASDALSAKLMAQISAAITRERIKLGMNQADFAEYIGASQSQISRWEHGDYNFSIKKLSEIAAKLNLNVNLLITNRASFPESYPSEIHTCTVCYNGNISNSASCTYTISSYSKGGEKNASVC